MKKLDQLDFPKMDNASYDRELEKLQFQLMQYQQQIHLNGERVIIAIEGSDASGKGELVKRLTHLMDPRGYQVIPIGAPDSREQKQHYLQRFWKRVPCKRQISIFDRTWYGRVLVEAVEHDLTQSKVESAFKDIESFERQLVSEGILLVKIFLHISYEEQTQRFEERLNDPIKSWKLTDADLASRAYWRDYQKAYQRMLDRSCLGWASWNVIPANNKKYARIEAMRIVVKSMENAFGPLTQWEIDEKFKLRAEQILSDQN